MFAWPKRVTWSSSSSGLVKGLVFVLLENQIVADHGDEAWERVQRRAGLEHVTYGPRDDHPHEDLLALLEAAEPLVGHTGRDLQRWFGRRALIQLASEFYRFFRAHDTTVSFAAALNEEVHPAVRKRYPGAEVPVFQIDDDPREGDLRLRYDSDRGLCSFAEGLIEGTGQLYGEKVTIEQPCCVHEGHPYCDLVLTIEGAAGEDPFLDLDDREHRRPATPV